MKRLRSYRCGEWFEASSGFRPLLDPSTGEQIAEASTEGIDFEETIRFARDRGGVALRAMTFAERGKLLIALSKALAEGREELLDLSVQNTGVTRRDAKFDIDGATGTLAYYGYLAKEIGDVHLLRDQEGAALGRSSRFWGQHVWTPLEGAAVLINAFNFPAWGFAEKMACAFLAGVPVIVKPATSSAWVTERCAEILIDSKLLPSGSFSLLSGSTGDLLDHLGPQDVLAFTGSADTGLKLRSHPNLLAESVRVNVEADSLNAAVLGPDVEEGSDTYGLFFRDVFREVTQKTGQKCTAVRRIFVPESEVASVADELKARFSDVVVGHPADASVTMGPLATNDQLDDTLAGLAELSAEGLSLLFGSGERLDGVGAEPGQGYFLGPHLFAATSTETTTNSESRVHNRELFGPVVTILPYDGSAEAAAAGVALGRGSLVTSVYSDDETWLAELLPRAAAWNGRLYLGSAKMAEQAPGSGLALPQSKHGGPGRAGGGQELGALRGLELYMQRVAIQGSRAMIDRLCGTNRNEST